MTPAERAVEAAVRAFTLTVLHHHRRRPTLGEVSTFREYVARSLGAVGALPAPPAPPAEPPSSSGRALGVGTPPDEPCNDNDATQPNGLRRRR